MDFGIGVPFFGNFHIRIHPVFAVALLVALYYDGNWAGKLVHAKECVAAVVESLIDVVEYITQVVTYLKGFR